MTDADADIKVEMDGRVWVVTLHGNHYQGTIARLDDQIDRVVETGTTIVLDLSDVEFIDGHLVAAVMRWTGRAQITDHEALALVVGEEHSVATRGFDLVLGTAGRVPCYTTKQAALTAIEQAG